MRVSWQHEIRISNLQILKFIIRKSQFPYVRQRPSIYLILKLCEVSYSSLLVLLKWEIQLYIICI